LLAEFNITVHGCVCYDMAADRMSLSGQSMGIYFLIFLIGGVMTIHLKRQLTLT